jgi:hypothetical protein
VIKRTKKLSVERETQLNAIGFAWTMRNNGTGNGTDTTITAPTSSTTTSTPHPKRPNTNTDWATRLEQLKEYKLANGDCNVHILQQQDNSQTNNIELARWLSLQRHKKKKNLLSDEREAKLNSIGGFVWNIRCFPDWNVRFRQLLEYKDSFGDCNVPQHFSCNPQLGRWVRTQRKTTKMLTKERWYQLNAIGFNWGKKQATSRPSSHLDHKWATVEQQHFNSRQKGVREKERKEDAPAEDVVSSIVVRPEEARSENEIRSENISFARTPTITSQVGSLLILNLL